MGTVPDRCPKCGGPLERWSDECPICTLGFTSSASWQWYARGLAMIVILLLLALCSRSQ
jgi:predicted amidophosphoribosyltransferase